MDEYNLPLVEKGALRIFLGCCCTRNKADFKLELDHVVEYPENNLQHLEIDTGAISGVSVGPRTVAELYSGPNLDGVRKLLMNPSYTNEKQYQFGCTNNTVNLADAVRSFRVWSYHYYEKVNNYRYCSNDTDCGSKEYCLCPNGQQQESWCPNDKRRCLPVSKHIQTNEPVIHDYDTLNKQCLANQIANLQSSTNSPDTININDIKKMAHSCAYGVKYITPSNQSNNQPNNEETEESVEGFCNICSDNSGYNGDNSYNYSIMYNILFILLVLYLIYLIVSITNNSN
ncbi:MAG: hypothetical protein Homavirus14_5 [Homavirus sp.]|uniref:Uncharacterized protein n=1 Tax=Homavirus sp. TaxID=2487769 RepID=A0A3G5AA18_9VIRU|nr:MAG: hypothetical protein Homavirus14_5 [Homavirus sp.]